MNRIVPCVMLVSTAFVTFATFGAWAQRTPSMAPDAYGYAALTSADAACPYQYLDLELDGQPLDLEAAGTEPAEDDGGAELALVLPFEFYGQPAQTLVASSNGYLAFGVGLDGEDGGYWRADCRLPAIPDNRRATFARLYALAGDLAQSVTGRLYAHHYAVCPRPSGLVDDEACTVVHWRGFERLSLSESLDFQAVLYHQSWQMVLQYRDLAADLSTPALTVGIQDVGAVSALSPGCAATASLAPASAICLFDPRFPPVTAPADVIFADGFDSAPP